MEKKTYRQKVRFSRDFVFQAKNAAEASDILQSLVDEVEFSSDAQCEGFFEFEDEPEPEPEDES